MGREGGEGVGAKCVVRAVGRGRKRGGKGGGGGWCEGEKSNERMERAGGGEG